MKNDAMKWERIKKTIFFSALFFMLFRFSHSNLYQMESVAMTSTTAEIDSADAEQIDKRLIVEAKSEIQRKLFGPYQEHVDRLVCEALKRAILSRCDSK